MGNFSSIIEGNEQKNCNTQKKGCSMRLHHRSHPKLGQGVVVIIIISFCFQVFTTKPYLPWDFKIKYVCNKPTYVRVYYSK